MCEHAFSEAPLELQRWVIAMILEYNSAIEKHPFWPTEKGGTHVDGAAVVAEETGELVRAALNYTYEGARYYEMHTEAIQVGATALRFLLNAPEKRNDWWPDLEKGWTDKEGGHTWIAVLVRNQKSRSCGWELQDEMLNRGGAI